MIDFEKAFNTLNRGKLRKFPEERGISQYLIRVVQSPYEDTEIKIKLEGKYKISKLRTDNKSWSDNFSQQIFILQVSSVRIGVTNA